MFSCFDVRGFNGGEMKRSTATGKFTTIVFTLYLHCICHHCIHSIHCILSIYCIHSEYNDGKFSILARGRTSFHLSALEATYIKTIKPNLYKQKEFVCGPKMAH